MEAVLGHACASRHNTNPESKKSTQLRPNPDVTIIDDAVAIRQLDVAPALERREHHEQVGGALRARRSEFHLFLSNNPASSGRVPGRLPAGQGVLSVVPDSVSDPLDTTATTR